MGNQQSVSNRAHVMHMVLIAALALIGAVLAASAEEAYAATDVSDVQVAPIKARKCTGYPVTPKVEVYDDTKELREGIDYQVSYSNNRAPGTATAVVRGIGDYSGSVVRHFTLFGNYDPVVAVCGVHGSSAEHIVAWLEEHGCRAEFTRFGAIDPAKYDGLVIPGGTADVDPALYGQKNTKSWDIDPQLDKRQFMAIRRFAAAGKPVLGVCRGEQVLNVAYGGTLIQHLGKVYKDLGKYHQGVQTVKIAKGSWLHDELGDTAEVYHYHHQNVDQVGKGFVATQWDSELGFVEAIEHESLPMWGVQYHPEDADSGEAGDKLANAFREECLKYAA